MSTLLTNFNVFLLTIVPPAAALSLARRSIGSIWKLLAVFLVVHTAWSLIVDATQCHANAAYLFTTPVDSNRSVVKRLVEIVLFAVVRPAITLYCFSWLLSSGDARIARLRRALMNPPAEPLAEAPPRSKPISWLPALIVRIITVLYTLVVRMPLQWWQRMADKVSGPSSELVVGVGVAWYFSYFLLEYWVQWYRKMSLPGDAEATWMGAYECFFYFTASLTMAKRVQEAFGQPKNKAGAKLETRAKSAAATGRGDENAADSAAVSSWSGLIGLLAVVGLGTCGVVAFGELGGSFVHVNIPLTVSILWSVC